MIFTKISYLYFVCEHFVCMFACMCTKCVAWCFQRPEEGVRLLRTRLLEMIVGQHLGIGNQT